MQSIFSNALSRAVAKHIDLSVTRRETLSWLTLLIMQEPRLWNAPLMLAMALKSKHDEIGERHASERYCAP